MDSKLGSGQDILHCNLCEAFSPPMYCDICHINLCKVCVGEHLSDISKEHKVVPFENRGLTTKCTNHSTKVCELHCEECNIPICSLCVSSKEHSNHTVVDILKCLSTKKELIKTDLKELQKYIYPKYKEIASDLEVQKHDLSDNSNELKKALTTHGEAFHKEIDIIIQEMQSEIDDQNAKHLKDMEGQADRINQTLEEIMLTIADMRKVLLSNDINFVSAYKSRNEEFKMVPTLRHISLPIFTPQKINREQIYQQIGFLTESDAPIETSAVMSSTKIKTLIEEPYIITSVNIPRKEHTELRSVSCLNDSELWITGKDKIIQLYNLQGELLQSVQTASGNEPWDITVTLKGRLVYTDPDDRTINIVENVKQIKQLIGTKEWKPLNIACSSSGDLLVIMISNDYELTQTKLARFSGSTEKQISLWDKKGNPLFSSGSIKYLCENRNLDICVADYDAGAVVVVNVAGKLRFRYTGRPSTSRGLLSKLRFKNSYTPSTTKESFCPYGITTDSQGKILTADSDNNRIHILDQDGHFLCFIDSCGLQRPYGLCLDSNDYLFVTEFCENDVKKIQYYK